MNKRLLPQLLLSMLITTLLLGGFSLPVSAGNREADSSKIETVITLTTLPATSMGEAFIVSGVIKDAQGRAVSDRSIQFTIDGKFLGQAHSDARGAFKREFTKSLDAGSYSIVAYWNGNHDLAPIATTAMLRITPALVRVQTFPAIAGMPFSMAGQRVVSDQDGYATFVINKAGQYRLEALVDEYHSTTQQITFGRWLQESYEPYSTINVPTDKPVQVGFNVFRLVGQTFVDLDGFQVDQSRVTNFMIRSAQGDVFIFNDGQPRWIPSSRIARRITGLEETRLLYSVISVTVDGSNVVNQSQQRFHTFPTENWPISLLLYSLRITAKDGLFGIPVGSSINLEYPDGRIENYPLEKDGTVMIRSLARGNYYTELVGAFGLKNRLPVSLSRNQDVITNVITYLDLFVISLGAGLVAFGLLLIGRPSLRDVLRPVSKQGQTHASDAPGLFTTDYTEISPDEKVSRIQFTDAQQGTEIVTDSSRASTQMNKGLPGA